MSRSDAVALSAGFGAYTMRSRSVGEIPGFDTTKHTDDPLMTVPVLGPQELARRSRPQHNVDSQPSSDSRDAEKSKPKFTLFGRMMSSVPDTTVDLVMRQVRRSEYLAHYAKDENGRYVGTDKPAEDCILSAEDSVKYRTENAMTKSASGKEVSVAEREVGQPEVQLTVDDGHDSRVLGTEHHTAMRSSQTGGLFRRSWRGSNTDDGVIR
ncbi:hypothetical protein LTR10_011764 [Elasticomyces elasticus]|uniref:Uncharacterized protein n=1 Tax=Exophiala sideris TaxID=1016849 RepID=A0ABR0JDP0_9EURO|nr:hypothetical protein LTR10_011764 [Elasticomyces elasticus]KAK5031779.1 hypothetical protein LTS07_004399 [Exophiala sideris]KAK5040708.1 hypothetical protein LTR13_003008 [Exophiala sideris]KAK5061958.1 hypothetical protein LTR69_005142 [Exophiala sideris]KAK5184658.1 hypothetical protein LTR44_003333 [Eurotiomycetes sp. CCFEE 6388]